MNTNEMIQVQAFVDDELTPREAAAVEALIARDTEAKELAAELRMTHDVLTANEPAIVLPESREFHWSKISREIERLESRPVLIRRLTSPAWWLKYVSPIAAAAVLAVAFIIPGLLGPDADVQTDSAPEASPVVFRSQAEGMTVIWLQGDENYEFAKPEGDF